jgi:UDP-N-acetyl-D-glucosamine dehydrogenase
MPKWVIGKLADALNRKCKSIKGSKVLVLGIAYKPNVDDMRESPSVKLMELLDEKGAIVNYSDPHVPVFPKMREHYFDLSSIELTPENIKKFDCVLIATNHKAFDYEMIKSHAQLIVDTRGVYKESFDELVRA